MNYREAIQIQIKGLQTIYDNAEGLRDIATEDEKEAFNELRRHLPALWQNLQRVDNKLTVTQSLYQCRGDYSVIVTKEKI